MKNNVSIAVLAIVTMVSLSWVSPTKRLTSKTGRISFFSHTPVEDIRAVNYKVVSRLDMATGAVFFSVPMQSFEFKKRLMQKHFNSRKFLNTKTYPKSKFKGIIHNIKDINIEKEEVYHSVVSGELTLHGVTNKIKEKISITIKENKIILDADMKIKLADYAIVFKKGKPSRNISKIIDVTIKTKYDKQQLSVQLPR